MDYHLARLKDKRGSVRMDAMQQLAILNPTGFAEIFQSMYNGDADAEVRAVARRCLLNVYAEALKSDQAAVRLEALRQCIAMDGSETLHLAQALLGSDEDERVRAAARQFVVTHTLDRLRSSEAAARLEAITLLEQMEAEEALDALQQVYAADTDPEVRKAAQRAGRAIFNQARARRAGAS
jgi:HEAT repeat protein